LVFPPGTTIEQVKFYQELFAPALNDPDVKKHLDELLTSVTPHLIDPVAARAYVQRLRDKWQPYAKRIQPE
jgi:tripartite-type tricarboxylate transporter receptor subunit TctC